MDLEVIAMKVYSTLPRSPELKPHHQMQYIVIHESGCLAPLPKVSSVGVERSIKHRNKKDQRFDEGINKKHQGTNEKKRRTSSHLSNKD